MNDWLKLWFFFILTIAVVYLDAFQDQKDRLKVALNSCVRHVLDVRGDIHITPFKI